ncbi:DUF1566 domain-containing protein [Methylomonas montana]|uniref:Lcl domain-containing protein n=1 Tax=Methylomonas montana TaxID=3058963 RepID=UPI002658443E|nr:DUF1566 domain-containing protein [Methylomonas montana]WKJ88857.1 DUF1566 domain-containing protein [Methylomonas montana]
MKNHHLLAPLSLAIFLSSHSVEASLLGRSLTGAGVDNNADTFEAYYDDDLGISWSRDASMFKTWAVVSGDAANFVNSIISAVGGRVYDTPNKYDTPANSGYHDLTAADFNTSTGNLSWFGAQAWVGYLNNIEYGGYSDWRLPTIPATTTGYDSTSEYGHLFYNELGGIAGRPISLVHNANYGLFANINDQSGHYYWSGTEHNTTPYSARIFSFYSSAGGTQLKDNTTLSAWVVRGGDVAAVPLPGAVWMFLTGLLGLLGIRRNQHSIDQPN